MPELPNRQLEGAARRVCSAAAQHDSVSGASGARVLAPVQCSLRGGFNMSLMPFHFVFNF